jgi:putative zinc finger/helix-turn-helix YgiT family protein
VCGEDSARLSFEDETFPYGDEKNQVILRARVPVWHCQQCRAQYTAAEAEDIRHAEVCRYLRRLTPAELRQIREKYGLSQQVWAERTALGVASVKRWETGNLIQNAAIDRYLRLLTDPSIFAKAASMSEDAGDRRTYSFQTELPREASQCAAVFVLRKQYGRN